MKKKYVYFVSFKTETNEFFGNEVVGNYEYELSEPITRYSQIIEIANLIKAQNLVFREVIVTNYILLRVEEVK